ncbi:hypothetical protein F4808DRAFT_27096 [Astrocystis sublimbata]|nr:hypothetical protein F4808DRAFT_27096 [Astrocystis sublimbata]
MRAPSLLLFPIRTMAVATSMLSAFPQGPHPVGLYSQYVVEGTGQTIKVMIPYYESDYNAVDVVEISGNYTPTAHYVRMDDRTLLERDICAKVTDCAGKAYSSLTTFGTAAKTLTTSTCAGVANSLESYLTSGNYKVSKQVIVGGAVVGLAVGIVGSFPTYYINAKLEALNDKSGKNNDVCGEKDPKTFSSNAASAVYEFCLSIQKEKAEEATANYDTLDTTNGVNTPTGGFEGRAKFFISEQAATWGDICHDDYGIDWKRGISTNWIA